MYMVEQRERQREIKKGYIREIKKLNEKQEIMSR